MDPSRVIGITAVLGEPSTFFLEQHNGVRQVAVSSSLLIQRLLLAAFVTAADVEVILVPGSSVVLRIFAFEAGKGLNRFADNEFHVSRLATQRNLGKGDEHLEAFLVDQNGIEKAYNAYDPSIEQLLAAAFAQPATPVGKILVHIEFDGEQITAARLGEAFESRPPGGGPAPIVP
jgi:hypothetical protein